MHILLLLIICLLIAGYLFDLYLDHLNKAGWDKPLPPELADLYTPEQYQKARDYHFTREKLGRISGTLSLVATLLMLLLGGFGWLNGIVTQWHPHPILQSLFFFGVLFIASDILSLPFSLYSIFRIEEKFGFNKMTPRLYLTDKLKGYLLSALLGAPLLAATYWYFKATGPLGWVWAWVTFTAFSLFMAMFYTSWIVPLFNKLSPLEPGPLRKKIEALANKVKFPLTNIFIIDGSKRSTKANAYFSGLGNKKSIVLYDTLVKEHSEEEIVAVLAHEVGHYKKKHIRQGMLLSVLHTGILLFLLSRFIFSPELSLALGVQEPTFHIGLIAFMMLWSPISMVTGIFMNMFSRKNEYEADRFAKDHYDAEPLISALKKLSAHNLSNLQPHPLVVFMHYSHPTLLQRIRALRA